MRLLILMFALALFTSIATYDVLMKRTRWQWGGPMKEMKHYERMETRNSIPLYYPIHD